MPQAYKIIGKIHDRRLALIKDPAPLVGHIAFGVIDRGTNVIQVRPSTICPHNCIYCSVDAGPYSKTRTTEFLVDARHIAKWTRILASIKNTPVEALIDGVGEPLTHPQILEIIRIIKNDPNVFRVAIETHGGFLSKKLAEKLDMAGLDRINLSIDSLDKDKAQMLAGVPWYDVNKILEVVDWILENTSIDVVLTPVVVPGINEEDMKDLIEYAKSRELGKKMGWPTGVLIQKYEIHRWGRKPLGRLQWSWSRFFKWLKSLEEETGYKLRPSMKELGIKPAPKLPILYRPGDRVRVEILGPGWHKGELLAMDTKRQRLIAVFCENCRPGQLATVRITRSKDNIYVARR